MKKILIILGVILLLGGCSSVNMENMSIVTSSYPVEFVTNELYKDNIKTMESIYPDSTDPSKINYSKKQINDFAKNDLFIYYGLVEKESNLAVKLKNTRPSMLIIDSSSGLSNTPEDLSYLDPTNIIMIAKNIKTRLVNMQNDFQIRNKLEDNYKKINIKLSNLDADIKTMAENAPYKKIIIDNNKLSFLKRYGLEVISLQDNLSERELANIRNLIDNGTIKYIYTLSYEVENEITMKLLGKTNAELIKLNPMFTLNDEERQKNISYFTLMNNNLNEIKKELYKTK